MLLSSSSAVSVMQGRGFYVSGNRWKGNQYRAGTARQSPEHDAQVALFDVLRLNERRYPQLAFIFAVPNGGLRNPITARDLKREGVKAGVSDICIPIASRGYGAAWIEMKAGKNKCTPEQLAFLNFVSGQNHASKICYSDLEAIEFIEWYLKIELERK